VSDRVTEIRNRLNMHSVDDVGYLLAENDRLRKIIARELSENDELGAEYTYICVMKEANDQQQAEIKRLEEQVAWLKAELEGI
jgi:hypothetical protein